MRVAVIYPEPLPSAKARAVTVVNTACALARRGLDTTLYTETGGKDLATIARVYECAPAGLSRRTLSRRGGFGLIRSHRFFNRRLSRALRSTAADILYVRHLKTAAHLISHRQPDQHIVFECHEIFHQTTEHPRRGAELRALETQVYRNADGLVFINRTLQQEVAAVFGHLAARQSVAWPGATPAVVNRDKGFDTIRDIYYIGSLYPWKGVETLLRAMPTVADTTLHLIGDADAGRRAEIEALIMELGLNGRVLLEGHRTHGEIRALLAQRAALTVLPNENGPFARFTSPLKLFEYMASGCAIVAADIETVREIGGKTPPFLSYPPGDAATLANRINHLRRHPDEARRLAAAALAHSRAFTWDSRAERLAGFFQSLLDAN